jgi:hypothetical protein
MNSRRRINDASEPLYGEPIPNWAALEPWLTLAVGADTAPTQSIGRSAEQERRNALHDRYDEEMPRDTCLREPIDIGQPRRGPQSLQRPSGSSATRRERRQAPEARIAIDDLQADGWVLI